MSADTEATTFYKTQFEAVVQERDGLIAEVERLRAENEKLSASLVSLMEYTDALRERISLLGTIDWPLRRAAVVETPAAIHTQKDFHDWWHGAAGETETGEEPT